MIYYVDVRVLTILNNLMLVLAIIDQMACMYYKILKVYIIRSIKYYARSLY